MQDGSLDEMQESSVVTLEEKLYEYAVRAKGAIAGIAFQLLTQGKVRVLFSDVSERLELLESSDKLSETEATRLFEDFLARAHKTGINLTKKSTQSIAFPVPLVLPD